MATHMLMRSVKVVRPSMANLTPSANTMFSMTMACVLLEIATASATFDGRSSTMTMSAASIAASEPRFPMAIPTSALASEGASFMPSPTKTVLPSEPSIRASSLEVLSEGRRSASKPSSPNSPEMPSAADLLSPVSMYDLIPISLSFSIASLESCFSVSDIRMCPA